MKRAGHQQFAAVRVVLSQSLYRTGVCAINAGPDIPLGKRFP